jgi:hypothetical protein
MPARMRVYTPVAYSAEALRSETARVLGAATPHGVPKLVAAASGVSRSRIDRELEALDANALEMLARWLDRLAREGASDGVAGILRWLSGRYGFDLVERTESQTATADVISTAASALREASEAIAAALEAAPGGISEHELGRIEREIQEGIEHLHRLARVVRARTASGVRSDALVG